MITHATFRELSSAKHALQAQPDLGTGYPSRTASTTLHSTQYVECVRSVQRTQFEQRSAPLGAEHLKHEVQPHLHGVLLAITPPLLS